MAERSGVGLVEVAILDALDRLAGRPDRKPVRNAKVLAIVADEIGLAPSYAYQVLADMALPWKMAIPLISGRGNLGSRFSEAAGGYSSTNSKLSWPGQVALAVERGELAPVPIGMINGNAYREGTRPAFAPQRIIDALRQVIERPEVSDADLTDLAGPPDYLTGCLVSGDLAALAAGEETELTLRARMTISDDGKVVVENIPPNVTIDEVHLSITERRRISEWMPRYPQLRDATLLQIKDKVDCSAEREFPLGRLICTPEEGAPPEVLRDQLADVYGITTTVSAALPLPLPAMLRIWVRQYAGEDLPASLTALETAIRDQPDHYHSDLSAEPASAEPRDFVASTEPSCRSTLSIG